MITTAITIITNITTTFNEINARLLSVKDVKDKIEASTNNKINKNETILDKTRGSSTAQSNKILSDQLYDYISSFFETIYNKVAGSFKTKIKYD